MEFSEEKERFPKTSRIYASMLFQIKGTMRGNDITISTAHAEHNNSISVDFANEIVIPESNMGERLHLWNSKEYEISNLQLNIGDYTGVSQFIVKSFWSNDGDLILGLSSIETLGTFILNTENLVSNISL